MTDVASAYPIVAQLRLEGPKGLVRRNNERLNIIPAERAVDLPRFRGRVGCGVIMPRWRSRNRWG